MNREILELSKFAKEIQEEFLGGSGHSREWMRHAMDLADSCIQDGAVRPNIEPSIPVRERGPFVRAAKALGAAASAYSDNLKAGTEGALATIVNLLEKASHTSQDTSWIDVRDEEVDALLKLSSRGAFDRDLGLATTEASTERPVSLVMIDLDHFKSINDQNGHQVGDRVLVAIANTIRVGSLQKGKAYRYGGDEFAVLLRNMTIGEAIVTAERILNSAAQIAIEGAPGIKLTLSIGVASSSGPSDASPEQLLKKADEQLYNSKRAGRNRVSPGHERGSSSNGQGTTKSNFLETTLTLLEKIAKEDDRKKRRGSTEGINAFRVEFDLLHAAIQAKIDEVRALGPHIDMIVRLAGARIVVRTEGFSLTADMRAKYANSLDESALEIGLWRGEITIPGEHSWEKPSSVGRYQYDCDITNDGKWGWRDKTNPAEGMLSTERLAEFSVEMIIRLVSQDRTKR